MPGANTPAYSSVTKKEVLWDSLVAKFTIVESRANLIKTFTTWSDKIYPIQPPGYETWDSLPVWNQNGTVF
jgi:hypothetical protein